MTAPTDDDGTTRRATVIGTGLIGGSVGLALRAQGWRVSGVDAQPGVVQTGIALGAFDTEGLDPASHLVVVATPVGAIPEAVGLALRGCPDAAVTDVGGVKASILAAVDDPRFVGGHPMAGSEQLGLEGSSAALFEGAAWVLTPQATTSDASFQLVRNVASSLGADVLTMAAEQHDVLVAVVSHVPHLTAASLVTVAAEVAQDHRAVLRLAAGGFRDMTRIAAGSPAIWPDVCAQNRDAIVDTIDRLIIELERFRALVDDGDRAMLHQSLAGAQTVRRNLPSRGLGDVPLVEVRIPIADRPGSIAAVAVLATENSINLRSLQTIDAADSEAAGGVASVMVAAADSEPLRGALEAAGYRAVVIGFEDVVES